MSVNTPASWSAHALRNWLGMPSGPAALRGLRRLNVLLMLAAVKESQQVLVAGCVSGTLYCPQSEQRRCLVGQGARHQCP